MALSRPEHGVVSVHSRDLIGKRTQKYLELGAPEGSPVFFLQPTNRPDFTAEIIDALAARDLRVICPVRPGSWGMPRWRRWGPSDAAKLHASLVQTLGLNEIVVAGFRTGAPYAIQLAHRLQRHVRGLVLIDSGAPLDSLFKFRVMPTWPRTQFTAARFFPGLLLLPYRYCALDFRSGGDGVRRAVEAFYRDSPVDQELLGDPEYFEIARRNIDYCFEHPDQVARDLAFWAQDWSGSLIDLCNGGTPVAFLHGSANPAFPAPYIHDFCEKHNGAKARIVDGAAQFLIYQHPDVLADELAIAASHAIPV